MDDSIRGWIPGLRQKKPHATEAFFRYAYPKMLRMARGLLHDVPRRESDEEDVVNAAFHSFLRRTADNQFQLTNSSDLWKVIQTIVARKAANHRRRQQRRIDHGEFDDTSNLASRDSDSSEEQVLEWMLSYLDRDLRPIARLKYCDRTNVEIAAELGRSVATIERRLKMIRSQWAAVEDEEFRAVLQSGFSMPSP